MTVIETESALTDRYQTTVPDAVRRALRLQKRDRIVYRVNDDGTVELSRKSATDEADPVIDRFLDFLAKDIGAHPERVQMLDASLLDRLRPLVAGVEIDLDAPLSSYAD